jgi:hypothetical protein
MGRSVTGADEAAPTSLKAQLIEWGRAAVPSIAGAIGFTGFVSVLGAAVVWMRFSTAGLPADQAVHDLPLSEWLATGAVSLILYLTLGLLAVLVVYLLQGVVISAVVNRDSPEGDPTVALQRELAVSRAHLKQLGEDLKMLAPEGKFPEPGTPEGDRYTRVNAEKQEVAAVVDQKATELFEVEQQEVKEASGRGSQWGLMLLAGAELVIVMLRTDISTIGKLVLGIVTAALSVLVLIGAYTIGNTTADREKTLNQFLNWLALSVLGVFAVVLVAVQTWTFSAVLAVGLLGLAELAIGRLHPQRFFWYGASIFASVGLFGAVLTYSRDQHAPSAQPAAVLLDDGCVVRGLWVGESSNRVFLARLAPPSEQAEGSMQRPAKSLLETGRVFWLDRSHVVSESVGMLKRLPAAEDDASEMRGELLALASSVRLTEKKCGTTTVHIQTSGSGGGRQSDGSGKTSTPSGGTPAKKG